MKNANIKTDFNHELYKYGRFNSRMDLKLLNIIWNLKIMS